MKRLEFFKGIVALSVLATAYNAHFDLIQVPKRADVHLAISFLCVLLFLAGLYHDRLSSRLLRRVRAEEHDAYPMGQKAASDLLFREGLIGLLLFIPVIPALLSFPAEPYLGLSLFLFPLHGLIRAYQTKWLKGMELLIGKERLAFPLRSTRSVRYDELREVALKYEHLYLILKDDRVETLPLDFLSDNKEHALERLAERLKENGIKGHEALYELAGSGNRSV
jgi:hypothetical protein